MLNNLIYSFIAWFLVFAFCTVIMGAVAGAMLAFGIIPNYYALAIITTIATVGVSNVMLMNKAE